MKKNIILITFSLLLFYVGNTIIAQGSETIELANLTSTYSDGSYTGDNGILWSYIHSRDDNGYVINGEGIMLRREANNSKITSVPVAGGIANFSCKFKKAFTGSGNRQIELWVNGVLKGTSGAFDDTMIHDFSVLGIDIAGNVTIEVRNTRSKQVIVDDISWTGFTTMPVTFSSFDVNTKQDNHLTWSTASEINNSHFNVLHSRNGSNYEAIGSVNGAGNSNRLNQYEFVHHSPSKGMNYYKLEQVDYDGKTSFSDVVKTEVTAIRNHSKYIQSNLVNDFIHISLEGEALFVLRSLSGQILINQSISNNTDINISSLQAGLYIAQTNVAGVITTEKIIKQ